MKLEESNMSDAWHNGQPNGGKGENCVTATDTGFVDDSCDSPHCGICELPTSPLFHMRGLCQNSHFGSEYSWTGKYSDEKAIFVGVRNEAILFWDESKKYWKLEHIEDKTTYAIMNETKKSYLFGKHLWYIFNDNCQNEGAEEGSNAYKTEMSFNACKEDMFNCHDGTWYNNLIDTLKCLGRSDFWLETRVIIKISTHS